MKFRECERQREESRESVLNQIWQKLQLWGSGGSLEYTHSQTHGWITSPTSFPPSTLSLSVFSILLCYSSVLLYIHPPSIFTFHGLPILTSAATPQLWCTRMNTTCIFRFDNCVRSQAVASETPKIPSKHFSISAKSPHLPCTHTHTRKQQPTALSFSISITVKWKGQHPHEMWSLLMLLLFWNVGIWDVGRGMVDHLMPWWDNHGEPEQ